KCEGQARLRTVCCRRINLSSSHLTSSPVNGRSPVLTTMPSLNHCQNCFWVVQKRFWSLQNTKAFFLFFFLIFGLAFILVVTHSNPHEHLGKCCRVKSRIHFAKPASGKPKF